MTKAVLIAAVLVLAAGCGRGQTAGTSVANSLPQQPAPKPVTWAQVSATLTPALEPGSSNPCEQGTSRCINLVLAEMGRREAPQSAACDHSAVFAQVYADMTAAIGDAARAGSFRDPRGMTHFDAWFARYYFRSADAWQANRLAAVPNAWQIAFTADRDRSVRGLGDVLLAMNAHISRDLPYAVADLVAKPATAMDSDFALVTRIIEGIGDTVLERVATRFDPTIRTAEIPLLLGGRLSFGEVVALWRAQSWARGIALRDAATPSEHAAIEQQIEASSLARAEAILAATAYVPLVESSQQRDAYCQAQR